MNMQQSMFWGFKPPRLSDLLFTREARSCFISYHDLIYEPDICPALWLPYASIIYSDMYVPPTRLHVYFNGYCIESDRLNSREDLQAVFAPSPTASVSMTIHALLRIALPVFEKEN